MRAFSGTVAATALLVSLFGACAGRDRGLQLATPAWIDTGTTFTIGATSSEGGVRVRVYDRSGGVVLDSKNEVADEGSGTSVRLFWQVPLDAKDPLRIEATDRAGAKRSRIVRRR